MAVSALCGRTLRHVRDRVHSQHQRGPAAGRARRLRAGHPGGRRPPARREAGRVAQPHGVHVRGRRGPVKAAALALFAEAHARDRPADSTRASTHARRGRRRALRPDRGRDDGRLRGARARGRRRGLEQYHLPVFLYEDAATTPARRNLEDIRRGEFEGLAAKLKQPEWAPDFGPAHAASVGRRVGDRRADGAHRLQRQPRDQPARRREEDRRRPFARAPAGCGSSRPWASSWPTAASCRCR